MPSSPRFWAGLLAQRPLLLLGSLWLVMICASAVAGHRLLFADPGKDTQAHRTQSQAIVPQARGQSVSPSEVNGEADDAAPTRQGLKVTFWGLSSLVGICALGSVVISQQAKAAARRRPKRRVRRVKPKAKAKAKAPTGPKRLSPYSPDRDAVIVKGAQAVTDTLPLSLAESESESESESDLLLDLFDDNSADTPPSPSLNHAASAPPAQPSVQGQGGKGKKSRPAAMAQPPAAQIPTIQIDDDTTTYSAEVLPQDEAHPLDWNEDSLAHALDLRQRRSLSSLM
ncbi:MAG: hypothetical protein ACHWZW_18985 [Spirulina sp.]